MIDVHCHLEQPDYDEDREKIIQKYRRQLTAVITSSAHPKDIDLTLKLVQKYQGFIFTTLGIHPSYIKDISEKLIDDFSKIVTEERDRIVGIGETGLDYYWVKEQRQREKQKELFIRLIALAQELNLPLVIHSREACKDTIDILESEDAQHVVMHMFGDNRLTRQIVQNHWNISMNAIVLKSKRHKKVIRDTPLSQLLLETDSPWLAPEAFNNKRNDSTTVRFVAERIAEIKKTSLREVDLITTQNAQRVFELNCE